MTTPMQERMEAAIAELRAQRDRIRELHGTLAARRTSVTSKNRMVAATVDSRGKLVELALKGNRYRTLAPAELASLIVETVAKAQDAALEESLGRAMELVPQAKAYAGLGDGTPDLDAIFDSAVRITQEPIFADEMSGDEGRTRDV